MNLMAQTSQRFSPPAIAFSGSEGAIAVAESTGTSWSVTLARFSGSGLAVGSPVMLGGSLSGSEAQGPTVTVAANGSEYLACWDGYTSATSGVALASAAFW